MRIIDVNLYTAAADYRLSDKHLVWSGAIEIPNRIISYPEVVLYNNKVFTFVNASVAGIKYRRARFVKIK